METTSSWVAEAKKALDWFIELMGQEKWHARRKKVVDYFHSIDDLYYNEEDMQADGFEKKFAPIAVYADWLSWYMYLVESAFERQGCDDPSQSARIYPFFSAIGRNIEHLKKMSGIAKRLKVLFNEGQNAPDTTLYELIVAAHYARDGWEVSFLEDHPLQKTPDLKIKKGAKEFWVECKRFTKVTEYAETERKAWQKRVKHLFTAMRIEKVPAFAEIVFKVPVEQTEETILGSAFTGHINSILEAQPTRPTSPQMIELLTGRYELDGNYTELLGPSLIEAVGPDDPLFVLNKFYGGVHEAYIAKWDCLAAESIDKKAKEISKMLSKALSQIPDQGEGIIHIGYETVTGPLVELKRHEKIRQVIDDFNYGSKNIHSIFFNALQLRPKVDGYDWAETVLFFEKDKTSILPKSLLLAPEDIMLRDDTHWSEDLSERTK